VVYPGLQRDAAGNLLLDSHGLIQYRTAEGLLTRNAVSESISSGQVLGSIAMFSVIYGLLLLVWLAVLNDKIHKGPQPLTPAERTTGQSLGLTVGKLLDHGASLSEAKDDSPD
jgi:hypothetical protein